MDKPGEPSKISSKHSSNIDHAAMTQDDIDRQRKRTSSSGSGDSNSTKPDSQVEKLDSGPEQEKYKERQKRYKDKTLAKAKEYFRRYRLYMEIFDKHHKDHGTLKYTFDEDSVYNINKNYKGNIEDISFIYQMTKNVKSDFFHITGNLQDYDTISYEKSIEATGIIHNHMKKCEDIIGKLEYLVDHLVVAGHSRRRTW
jgi:hypothetical protein